MNYNQSVYFNNNTNSDLQDFENLLNDTITFESCSAIKIFKIALTSQGDNFKKLFSKVDKNGDTAFSCILYGIIDNPQSYSVKNEMLIEKFTPEFKYLLDLQNEYGETPLHIATMLNNLYLVKLLVKKKVDGSIKDQRNMTAMDIAILMDQKNIMETLKELENCTMSDVRPSIYQWGQIFTSSLSLTSIGKPTTILFNDELSSPIQTEFGQNFSLTLTDTGHVYSSGLCSYNKTGHKLKRDIILPTRIPALAEKRIKSIACGVHHSLALDDHGNVYSWGSGANGRLGLGDEFGVQPEPTVIPSLANQIITSISAGSDNSMVINKQGHVFSFGSNLHGKLGHALSNGLGFISTPLKIENLVAMEQVACSNFHSVLLDRKGIVYTFGSNLSGRLGRALAKSVTTSHYPSAVDIGEKIKKIACGTNFTTCLSENGTLWSWGSNNRAQLGWDVLSRVSEYFDKPKQVKALESYPIHSFAVGDQHVVCLTDQGEVLCYGDNAYLQCGRGELLRPDINLTKIQTTYNGGGENNSNNNNEILGTVFKISAGGSNTMISLSSDHHIFGEELLKNLNSSMFSDIRLIVNNKIEQYIMAHKVVLAARCSKLNELIKLQIKNPNESQSISISMTNKLVSFINKDEGGVMYINFPVSSLTILNLFLKYIYSDHTILSSTTNPELGQLAHSLGIDRLSYLCNFQSSKSLGKLPESTLLQDFKILKEKSFSKIYSDIKFCCNPTSSSSSSSNDDSTAMVDEAMKSMSIDGEEDDDFEKVSSYKLFAYTGSSYFRTMFGGSFMEKDKKEIQLFESSSNSLKLLLNYCYCEEIPEDVNDAIEMIIICDAHQIIRAKESAAAKIRSCMDDDSICYIYHVANIYNVKPLKIWCVAKLTNSKIQIDKLPYFNELPLELQFELLEIENSNKKRNNNM